MTVNELWRFCVDAKKEGLGSKKILVWNDDEGNGYHELIYPFESDKTTLEETFKSFGDNYNPNNYVFLG